MNIPNDAIITELLFEHALRIRAGSETSQSADEAQGEASEKQSSFVGRLNNLVASDLENVRQGNKIWLQLCKTCLGCCGAMGNLRQACPVVKVPVLVAANIAFVYGVLGYRYVLPF